MPGCGCTKKLVAVSTNLSKTTRYETFQGRKVLVVPLVMLRQMVVNGGYVDVSELIPESWNGVPVTVSHPVDNDGLNITANTPTTMEQWSVGMIFNAHMKDDKLCAEAWIFVDEMKARGLSATLNKLEAGEAMDVSTGYFSVQEAQAGEHGGKQYTAVHKDLKPDHLALLPDEPGACGWKDGCGVRANSEKGGIIVKVKEALTTLVSALGINVNLEVQMDKKQMVDLLVNKKAAQESERESLMALSEETLKGLVKNAEIPPAPDKKKEEEEGADKKKMPPEPDTNAQKFAVLSAEDRAALDAAKGIVAARRGELVSKIVGNSDMKKEALDTMDMATLQTIADGIRVQADDFTGRAGGATQLTDNAGMSEEELAHMAGNVYDFKKEAKK